MYNVMTWYMDSLNNYNGGNFEYLYYDIITMEAVMSVASEG